MLVAGCFLRPDRESSKGGVSVVLAAYSASCCEWSLGMLYDVMNAIHEILGFLNGSTSIESTLMRMFG